MNFSLGSVGALKAGAFCAPNPPNPPVEGVEAPNILPAVGADDVPNMPPPWTGAACAPNPPNPVDCAAG